jgi:hypothetical protein
MTALEALERVREILAKDELISAKIGRIEAIVNDCPIDGFDLNPTSWDERQKKHRLLVNAEVK